MLVVNNYFYLRCVSLVNHTFSQREKTNLLSLLIILQFFSNQQLISNIIRFSVTAWFTYKEVYAVCLIRKISFQLIFGYFNLLLFESNYNFPLRSGGHYNDLFYQLSLLYRTLDLKSRWSTIQQIFKFMPFLLAKKFMR